jgi:hypothetical protein
MSSVNSRNHIVAGALALALTLTANLALADSHDRDCGAPGIAPAHSQAYGKSLTDWLETYWRWYYTGADPAQSTVGHVQLMPLPAGTQISGSWTPADPALLRGQLDITLLAGTPFVLPEFAWVWERYQGYPTVPDDVPIADAVALAAAHPRLTFDGRTVLSDANKAAYYVPDTAFDPIVVYPTPTSYGSVAALSFQSLGVVGEPLCVGKHVLHLYEPEIFNAGDTPIFPTGYGVIFDNTWNVTVLPEDLGNHDIAPPNSEPYGKTYGEWSAAWWTWAMELPVTGPIPHPFVDDPAFDVTEGQHGNVWFLAAPFGTVTRTCTIPAGKVLFVGLLNAEASDLEGLGTTEAEQRASAKWQADHIHNVACSVDGDAVEHIDYYRVESPQFSFTAPTPWIFGSTGGTGTSVSDGYFVMLKPLSKGSHTLHYSGNIHFAVAEGDPYDFDGSLDMTYHLNVAGDHRGHDDH